MLNHRGFGVQESEKGAGAGFTLGYRYFFKPQNIRFFIGVRNDLWFNKVNWKNNISLPGETSGVSKIIVLQPTAIIGYKFELKKNWMITPNLAFGAEFNVKTKGVDVGQGLIILWGLDIQHRFFLNKKKAN